MRFLLVLWVSHPEKAILGDSLMENRAADNYIFILANFSVFLNHKHAPELFLEIFQNSQENTCTRVSPLT